MFMDYSRDGFLPTRILDPSGRTHHLKLVDEPSQFRGEPGTIPLWFIAICLLIPYILSAWYWWRELAQGIDGPLQWIGLIIWCCAGPSLITVFYFLNRHFTSKRSFFNLDRTKGTLALPREDVVLTKSDIVQFVQVAGYVNIQGERMRVYELCVLRNNPNGTDEYLPVAIDDTKRYISRAGATLAEFYSVPMKAVSV